MDKPSINMDCNKSDILPTITTTNTGNTSLFITIKEYITQIFDISKNIIVAPSKVFLFSFILL